MEVVWSELVRGVSMHLVRFKRQSVGIVDGARSVRLNVCSHDATWWYHSANIYNKGPEKKLRLRFPGKSPPHQ